uniref:Orotidine 5'-phosphate decarboxylase n=1 Tax=Chromera velia CCMP2878 TaxID=1169474 RepID=A0A0G4I343_9ALVE|eukprot:Cvel_10549.t1-p1 / transcript=Cvel_10549.t1 / gene=Cvel_10549 / organism=Chromera_velia_CCMP2878 / gene_product=Orotidine 5'-phosphate decarboxylase, putative / transcript_product=Orotidine 5'-phosphate decarboxylase, putative / location=Cvel_scaffold638:73436-75663(-) / protein_length=318 / sequence_SO=supercontig / SO=protein_coding / is_pseudo=false
MVIRSVSLFTVFTLARPRWNMTIAPITQKHAHHSSLLSLLDLPYLPVGSMPSFFDLLVGRIQSCDSLLCVGLDPHGKELAKNDAEHAKNFCLRLIDETSHVACCYKPNAAFFEVFGDAGFVALKAVIDHIPKDIPVLLDCKRGDIGSTATAYAVSAYEHLKAHGITLSPYMGRDSIAPFVREDRGVFVVCKSSNPGSGDLQTLQVVQSEGDTPKPLYLCVADMCVGLGENVGLVVGATDTDALEKVRASHPRVWILAPGVGAQGGDLRGALEKGLRADGMGMILPVSRGISQSESPRQAAEALRAQINEARKAKTGAA